MSLYIIKTKGDDYYKFGVSGNPWARVKSINTGNHLECELVAVLKTDNKQSSDMAIEAKIHAELEDFHSTGEWFKMPINQAREFARKYGFQKPVKPTPPRRAKKSVSKVRKVKSRASIMREAAQKMFGAVRKPFFVVYRNVESRFYHKTWDCTERQSCERYGNPSRKAHYLFEVFEAKSHPCPHCRPWFIEPDDWSFGARRDVERFKEKHFNDFKLYQAPSPSYSPVRTTAESGRKEQNAPT